MQIRADLHVHTTYSNDSLITPQELVYYAKQKGLNAVAVTDHNTLEGAWKIARETKDFLVLPGVEVSSADGHIVALNIKELIPRGLSAEETVARIHSQGGVAVACHPYAFLKGCLNDKVSGSFDAIEIINARAFPFGRNVRKAEAAAKRCNLSRVAGTDSHYGRQIGTAYTIIQAQAATVDSVCKAIVAGNCEPCGCAVPLMVNVEMNIQRLKRMIKKASHTTNPL